MFLSVCVLVGWLAVRIVAAIYSTMFAWGTDLSRAVPRIGLASWARWIIPPLLVPLSVWACAAGVPQTLLWRAHEPRLRTLAEKLLAETPNDGTLPRPDDGWGSIGSTRIYDARIDGDRVKFSFHGPWGLYGSECELIYASSQGDPAAKPTTPTLPTGGRLVTTTPVGTPLGERWTISVVKEWD